MGSIADLLAALEAVHATIGAARERMAAGAEKIGDTCATLSHGRATGRGGRLEPVVSGELEPETRELDPRYVEGVKLARRIGRIPPKSKLAAAGDVELKWALQMREDGVKQSSVVSNNPKGPCRGDLSCDTLLPV